MISPLLGTPMYLIDLEVVLQISAKSVAINGGRFNKTYGLEDVTTLLRQGLLIRDNDVHTYRLRPIIVHEGLIHIVKNISKN